MLNDLYPLSTQDGVPIPLDIIRPYGTMRLSIPTGTGLSLVALGVTVPILILRSTVDCFIRFGTVASVPVGSVLLNSLFLPSNETIVVAPSLTSISVIEDGVLGTGKLTIQLVEQWAGLGRELPYRN